MGFEINAFYKFVPLAAAILEPLRSRLNELGQQLDLRGLLLLAQEGCNGTVSGTAESMSKFRELLMANPEFSDLDFKISFSSFQPFRRWKVDVRREIVTFDGASLKPGPGSAKKLSPRQWHEALKRDDVVVLDTRNIYETEIGKFTNAVDPRISAFGQFSDFVKNSGIPRERTVLMYCTGGIRCEKASLEMERHGYFSVYQLEGGILKYLEEFRGGEFQGECFVFDHRVAVDKNLQPSETYKLCPHCGNPASQQLHCRKCAAVATVCSACTTQIDRQTCSKNCAEFMRRHQPQAAVAS